MINFKPKPLKYIRVENETKPRDLLQYLYNKNGEGWKLSQPRLILSITGGAQAFKMSPPMKQAFKTGLIKVI